MVRDNSEAKTISPFLSFVVTARNDDYGGNFLRRFQIFINALLYLVEKYFLPVEIIIVEWNPPPNEKNLAEVLIWPKSLKYGQVRFIEVPNEVHKNFPNSDKIPLFEYIAKNVGIRRAKGEYVLATNPDLIFSQELIKFLATKELSTGCFYRLDRYDVEKEIPLDISIEEQLEFCKKNWTGICTFKGSFTRGHWWQNLLIYFYNLAFRLKGRLIGDFRYKIYTAASGDFFLMANHYWQKFRAYPELATSSFIDGYICFQAASSGLNQVILDRAKRIYHQEHNRLEQSKRPLTNYRIYRQHIREMMKKKKTLIFNDENWGLGNLKLKEYYI